MTLLLSSSICVTRADTGGEVTLASVVFVVVVVAGCGEPVTWMPSAASRPVKALAGMAGGAWGRAARFDGSSESSGWPAGVSRPWSTSRGTMGVTSPAVTYAAGQPGARPGPVYRDVAEPTRPARC